MEVMATYCTKGYCKKN